MNVLLLSTPRSGSTYLSELLKTTLKFEYEFIDPVDTWNFVDNAIENQKKNIKKIQRALASDSVFVRHNSHFFGLDPKISHEIEQTFKHFHVVKLIRSDSLFDMTLSHCYAMLTGIPHDCFFGTLPKIYISKELYLQELEVCKLRQQHLESFPIYDEKIYYNDLKNKHNTLKFIKLDWEAVSITPNSHKSLKITNYNELYEEYGK